MMLFTAQLISFLSYPYLIIPAGAFLIFHKETNSVLNAVALTVGVSLFLLVVLGFELIGMRMGMFSNFDISKRKQRTNFYLFVLLLLAAVIISSFFLQLPSYIAALAIGMFIGISTMALVNRKIKASIHVTTISAILITVAFLYGNIFYFTLLLIPLIAWSRVKTNRHTLSETITGVILGIFITVLLYAMVQYYPAL